MTVILNTQAHHRVTINFNKDLRKVSNICALIKLNASLLRNWQYFAQVPCILYFHIFDGYRKNNRIYNKQQSTKSRRMNYVP